MVFEIYANLDKIKIKYEEVNEQQVKENLKNELLKVVSSNFKIYEIDSCKQEIYGPRLGLKYLIVCSKDNSSNLAVRLKFTSELNEECLKSIYNAFNYLLTLATSKEHFSIEAEYSISEKVKDDKFCTILEKEHTRWDYKNYGDINIIDFLKYITCERPVLFGKEYFLKFENELKNKEKYKEILQNINNYEKKCIPDYLQDIRTHELKFKNIDIIDIYRFDDTEDLISQIKNKKGFILPLTGGSGAIILVVVGITLIGISIKLNKKEQKNVE